LRGLRHRSDANQGAIRIRRCRLGDADPLRRVVDAGEIAARTIRAGDETSFDWVRSCHQDNWNRRHHRFGRVGATEDGDHSRPTTNQIGLPIATLCNAAKQGSLFDHLVGAGEQRRRDGDPDRLRRLEVYHEIEPSRLFAGTDLLGVAMKEALKSTLVLVIWIIFWLAGTIGGAVLQARLIDIGVLSDIDPPWIITIGSSFVGFFAGAYAAVKLGDLRLREK